MAAASNINRVPPGLLSLLAIKSLGQNPSLLSDTVQPSIELYKLYSGVYAEEMQATVSAPANVGIHTANAAVPGPGEIWIVSEFTLTPTAALAAGTTYGNICPVMVSRSSNAVYSLDPGTVQTASAGQQLCIGVRDFILPTNFTLGMFVGNLTLGTALDWYVFARFVRLLV